MGLSNTMLVFKLKFLIDYFRKSYIVKCHFYIFSNVNVKVNLIKTAKENLENFPHLSHLTMGRFVFFLPFSFYIHAAGTYVPILS